MAENRSQQQEGADTGEAPVSGAEEASAGAAEGLYELDIDACSDSDIGEAFEDAVAAIDAAAAAREAKEQAAEAKAVEEEAAEAEPRGRGEADELRQHLARTLADFDNYRKRTDREKETLSRFAISDVARDFLGVIDNLERAMSSSGGIDDLKQGLQMILRQQEEMLRRHGVERIESVGQPFDPTLHEAVMREEGLEVEVATVTVEHQPGYLLYDRLLRPAMVNVAMPVPRTPPEETAEDAAAEDSEPAAGAGTEDSEQEVSEAVD